MATSTVPDVALIGSAKVHLIDLNRRVQLFVPDLTIEIVSQNDKFQSVIGKAARYRKCGTKEVWVLDPGIRQAIGLTEDRQEFLNDEQRFESKLIPGFAIRLADLFDSI